MRDWLLQVSYGNLLIAAILLGLAPFSPQPHVVEKVTWLLTSQPFRWVDTFDLLFHLSPVILMCIKCAVGYNK